MPHSPDPVHGFVIEADRLRDWTCALVRRVGTPDDIAADVAEVLLASDLRGIASHGTARLPQYLKLVESGALDPAARPTKEVGRPAIARFDAKNGWGHHAGRVATDDAIERARETGTAISVMRHANHFGIAGWYAMRVAQKGLIGLSLTNSAPVVAPTRARICLLGTNPIAFAAPAGRFGMLVLDMATSTVSRGRIEVAARRGETLPVGWAIGPDGSPATTPEVALRGALQPLGGAEETGGYKGYGLALLVEVLTGILGDAAFGPDIVGLFSTEGRPDLGQLFMAIDPGAIGKPSAFESRLERLLDLLTGAPLIPGAPGPVFYPGQPEAQRAEKQARDGITVDREHHACLVELAERYRISFPEARPIG
jgi:LDH2 family malate/lactate/ureidoglycolate dehydrogenase